MAKTRNKKTTVKSKASSNGKSNGAASNGAVLAKRIPVQKTYKLYIGGKFPRTESGRYYKIKTKNNSLIANVCRGSRKDFRNAVVAARKALGGWANRTAYNRSQILYRIAEMLEWRKAQFIEELQSFGVTKAAAEKEVEASIDRLIYYAGWADKYQQLFSTVNPVASSHFNFSILEPMGVIAAFAPEDKGLLGLITTIAPIICGGNSCVVLASHDQPTCAISFAEVLHTSDVPGGVVNILTGIRSELASHFSSHMDVNGMVYYGKKSEELKTIQLHAVDNLKRIIVRSETNLYAANAESPYLIQDTLETKTTWHPIAHDMTGGGGAY